MGRTAIVASALAVATDACRGGVISVVFGAGATAGTSVVGRALDIWRCADAGAAAAAVLRLRPLLLLPVWLVGSAQQAEVLRGHKRGAGSCRDLQVDFAA